jgi:hypothetical protein
MGVIALAFLILVCFAVFCVYAITELTELIRSESRLASEQPAEPLPVLGGHGSAGVYDWADDYGDAA